MVKSRLFSQATFERGGKGKQFGRETECSFPGGGYSGFQVGDDRKEAKIKTPKKPLGLPTKPKKSHAEFPGLKIFRKNNIN